MISQELIKRIKLHQQWQVSHTCGSQLFEEDLDFAGATLDGLELLDAQIAGAIFEGSSLRNANLSYSNLVQARFRGCDMSGCCIAKADLSEADLSYANLSGAKLYRTDFDQADLRYCNLNGATFGGGHLGMTDLRGADLTNCDVSRTRFERTRLMDAKLHGLIGIDQAFVRSIDVGTLLEGDGAREWLATAAARKGDMDARQFPETRLDV